MTEELPPWARQSSRNTRDEFMRKSTILMLAAGLGLAGGALAETITYRYDARGRLVKVERSGSVNNNVTVNYSYDKADNRTNKTVSGAP